MLVSEYRADCTVLASISNAMGDFEQIPQHSVILFISTFLIKKLVAVCVLSLKYENIIFNIDISQQKEIISA